MLRQLRLLITCSVIVWAFNAQAVTVQDQNGTFTLDKVPQRIVVLELSFADALAAVNVSPVGIADDNDAQRLLPEVRQQLQPWQSVGLRGQPSLEAISALHPDLIIADSSRHSTIYAALQRIAPVLLLQSRNETYQENLHSAAIIGDVVGKHSEMQQRLAVHQQRMQSAAAKLPAGTSVLFGTSRENQFTLHSATSYTGGVLMALGLQVPQPINNAPMTVLSLEQLLAQNPNWLLVAHYRKESIVKTWQRDPLWSLMNAEQQHHIRTVDSNSWARARGLFAAEKIASDAVTLFATP
ncbi:Fe(3+)-dicitrate ABC transporter substrate-binding protein FecB [Pantoea rodasii]|uniref:Fe(3+)-dicitrate ABC transporter substrate-binding protein FecB n=1 Tax=Pantoea rodasii TaxID=1076549 RepID=A0A2M9W622_9GAMM|nr:Fe(3+) dicitrate ABC transporter substrate-binding protein [Pantoea rodasii]ORM65330.1 iron-dicitrate transporter substrate-binding subunit [Pantoea rodasii]PJZ02959.1 Fe(3+)-dicitrate ABC transporter substrate-binding protein FecB [Pantoea rodasii]